MVFVQQTAAVFTARMNSTTYYTLIIIVVYHTSSSWSSSCGPFVFPVWEKRKFFLRAYIIHNIHSRNIVNNIELIIVLRGTAKISPGRSNTGCAASNRQNSTTHYNTAAAAVVLRDIDQPRLAYLVYCVFYRSAAVLLLCVLFSDYWRMFIPVQIFYTQQQ